MQHPIIFRKFLFSPLDWCSNIFNGGVINDCKIWHFDTDLRYLWHQLLKENVKSKVLYIISQYQTRTAEYYFYVMIYMRWTLWPSSISSWLALRYQENCMVYHILRYRCIDWCSKSLKSNVHFKKKIEGKKKW